MLVSVSLSARPHFDAIRPFEDKLRDRGKAVSIMSAELACATAH
jgi:hypothetical protein